MSKLTWIYLFLIISLISPTDIVLIRGCYASGIIYEGFFTELWTFPKSIDEIQGLEIGDVIIKTNGFTDGDYFKPFLYSQKGEKFSMYNIRRDLYRILYLTQCDDIKVKIMTNGYKVNIQYKVIERESQGMLTIGGTLNYLGMGIKSWNYNRTGSKYGLSLAIDNMGGMAQVGYTLISPNKYKSFISYGNSIGNEVLWFGISDFETTLSLGAEQYEEGDNIHIMLERKYTYDANEISLSGRVSKIDNGFDIAYKLEPWTIIPFWKQTIKYSWSNMDILYLKNGGYNPNDYSNGNYQVNILEEFYLPFSKDNVLLYGGYIEYTSFIQRAFLSIGTGVKLNILPMGKVMSISIAYPLVFDQDEPPHFILNGKIEDIF